jgi:hypothetical protein
MYYFFLFLTTRGCFGHAKYHHYVNCNEQTLIGNYGGDFTILKELEEEDVAGHSTWSCP